MKETFKGGFKQCKYCDKKFYTQTYNKGCCSEECTDTLYKQNHYRITRKWLEKKRLTEL